MFSIRRYDLRLDWEILRLHEDDEVLGCFCEIGSHNYEMIEYKNHS